MDYCITVNMAQGINVTHESYIVHKFIKHKRDLKQTLEVLHKITATPYQQIQVYSISVCHNVVKMVKFPMLLYSCCGIYIILNTFFKYQYWSLLGKIL